MSQEGSPDMHGQEPRGGSRGWIEHLTTGRGSALALLTAVAVGLAARLVIQRCYSPLASDSIHYVLLGRSLAAGGGFVSGGSQHPDFSRSPMLPLAIAGISRLTGWDAERAGLLAVALFSALIVVPLFFLARSLFGPRAALAALPLGALSCTMGPSIHIMPTAPHLLFVLAAAAVAWSAARRPRRLAFFAAGILAGAAALSRTEGLIWLPALALWVACDAPDLRGRNRRRTGSSSLLSRKAYAGPTDQPLADRPEDSQARAADREKSPSARPADRETAPGARHMEAQAPVSTELRRLPMTPRAQLEGLGPSAGGGAHPAHRDGRFTRAGLLLAGGLLLYAPYAAWVSVRLGRFSPAPGIEYLTDMRWVCERLHLRDMEGPYLPWSERTVFALASDHQHRVLETYFDQRVLLAPAGRFAGSAKTADDMSASEGAGDASSVASPPSPAEPAGTVDPSTRQALVRRRLQILTGNLRELPSTLYRSHFLPFAPVALALIGLVTGYASPGRRRGLTFLAVIGTLSLAPLLSHIEARFLYVPFAFALVLGAGGWSWLTQRMAPQIGASIVAGNWMRHADGSSRGDPEEAIGGLVERDATRAESQADDIARVRGRPSLPRRVLPAGVHAGLLVLVALAGFRHTDGVVEPLSRRVLQKEMAALAASCPGIGPILAVQQHVSYFAGRPYRAIPVGDPALVLDYARRQGASCLVLEGDRDLRRRPELVSLMNDPPPSGLRLLAARPHPEGGEMRLFCVEP